ncbi:MAG: hypothetical protein ACRC7N_20550 [Clostridium sp.]
MGATLDLNIVSTKNININKILILMEKSFNVKIGVNEIEIIDDWEYSNVIYELEIDNVCKYIEVGKIANIQLNANNKFKMGCQIEKENGIYLTNLWIDTEKLQHLDSNSIIAENEMFYNKLIDIISELSNIYEIIISSVGVESTLEYSQELEAVIRESENINMWFTTNKALKTIEGFHMEKLTDKVNVFKKLVDA